MHTKGDVVKLSKKKVGTQWLLLTTGSTWVLDMFAQITYLLSMTLANGLRNKKQALQDKLDIDKGKTIAWHIFRQREYIKGTRVEYIYIYIYIHRLLCRSQSTLYNDVCEMKQIKRLYATRVPKNIHWTMCF